MEKLYSINNLNSRIDSLSGMLRVEDLLNRVTGRTFLQDKGTELVLLKL